jgi:hypothetical protein
LTDVSFQRGFEAITDELEEEVAGLRQSGSANPKIPFTVPHHIGLRKQATQQYSQSII